MRMDFRLSEGWDEDFPDMATVEETDLRYYVAQGDLVLGTEQADLSADWGWIPLVDFALALREIGDALAEAKGSETFEFTESEATLQFDRVGDKVLITSSYAPGEVTVPFSDFREQVNKFAQRLDKELLHRHPELGLNPAYQRLKLSRSH